MRKYLTALAIATFLAACGDTGGDTADCLTPQQVQQKINEIAGGFETSDEEVAQKQAEIKDIRARECK